MTIDLIPTSEAAKKLGYTLQHTRLLIRNQKLVAKKVGRDWLISPKALLSYIQKNTNKLGGASRLSVRGSSNGASKSRDGENPISPYLGASFESLRKYRASYFLQTDSSKTIRQAAYKELEVINASYENMLLFFSGNAELDNYSKKSSGVFLTPYHVAFRIVSLALESKRKEFAHKFRTIKELGSILEEYRLFLNLTVIDPACGAGVILSAAVEYLADFHAELLNILEDRRISVKTGFLTTERYLDHLVSSQVYGIDIDPRAAETARAVLSNLYSSRPGIVAPKIMVGDSIQIENNLFSLQDSFSSLSPLYGKGFDVVVMNPPYERLKIDQQDLGGLFADNDYCAQRRKTVSDLVAYIRNSGNFPLSSYGVLDMYKIFLDLAFRIAAPNADVGFIVPLTILGDRSGTELRKYMLSKCTIHKIDCIPEQAKLFAGVSQAFCIMGLRKAPATRSFTISTHSDRMLREPVTQKVEAKDIIEMCGQSLPIPTLDRIGWDVLKKISRFKKVAELPFIRNLRGELDLTAYSSCISESPTSNKLIRGDMVKPFSIDTEASTKKSYVLYDRFLQKIKGSSKVELINKTRIVGQQISNMAQLRRLKFGLVKGAVLANSCNFVVVADKIDAFPEQWVLSLLNSALMNWRFKITSTNNHINNYEIDELPLAPFPKHADWGALAKMVSGQISNFSDDRQAKIDALVFMAYGLSEKEASATLRYQGYLDSYIEPVIEHMKEYACATHNI